jgi:hypothetical protein
LPIASNETKAVANSLPKYFMGSSTMFTSISEAVAAKCLCKLFSQTLRQTNKGKGLDLNSS